MATLTISGINTSNNTNKLSFATEINSIEMSVGSYYIKNGVYPVENAVLLDTSNITPNALRDFTDNGEKISNNKILLNKIDYKKMNYTNLKYGTGEELNDMYVVSNDTGKVYYAKGLKIGGKIYFSYNKELKNILSYNSDKSITLSNPSIVYIPSKIDFTNTDVSVIVKVPKNYVSTIVKANENVVALSSSDNIYNIYNVANVGNYKITVEYKIKENDTISKKSIYNVTNVDKVAPEFSIDINNQVISKDITNKVIGYTKIISKTDNLSGIKKIKYDNTKVLDNIKEHFEVAGKDVIEDTIIIHNGVRGITVYIEDYAGNGRALYFDVKI